MLKRMMQNLTKFSRFLWISSMLYIVKSLLSNFKYNFIIIIKIYPTNATITKFLKNIIQQKIFKKFSSKFYNNNLFLKQSQKRTNSKVRFKKNLKFKNLLTKNLQVTKRNNNFINKFQKTYKIKKLVNSMKIERKKVIKINFL